MIRSTNCSPSSSRTIRFKSKYYGAGLTFRFNQDQLVDAQENTFQDLIGKGPKDILTATDLLYYIKGSDAVFEYALVLDEPLETPLVKERNFT